MLYSLSLGLSSDCSCLLFWLKNKFICARKTLLLAFVIVLGVWLRLYVARMGHNFDLESYWIVGGIVFEGGNVYAETNRYNYGPVWFYFLGFLYDITRSFGCGFHFFGALVSLFLTLVDIGIFLLLKKHFGVLPAILFFLNPISIIITGYHRQFDNLAILIGLYALTLLDQKIDRKNIIWSSVFLGISITTKHIFFLLPLWLFFSKEINGIKNKLIIFLTPLFIFTFSFSPYLYGGGIDGIIRNVFLYKSFDNSPLWFILAPALLQEVFSSKFVFMLIIALFGLIFRKLKILELGLLYTLVLVVFAPAIANQYLAIPLAAISTYPNIFFVLYTYLSFLLLVKDGAGLNMPIYTENLPFDRLITYTSIRAYDLIILFLFFGLVCNLLQRYYTFIESVKKDLIRFLQSKSLV